MSDLLRSYLVAWLFFLAISLGAMANLMLHSLTGGRWGQCVRPAWLAATRLMPVLALLFAPIAVGVSSIYPWSDTPGAWLNVPFFTARSIGYLLVWVVLAQAFLRADRASVDPALGANRSERRVAAAGLVIYALTMSLAAVDWIASLTPRWHSSGFGLLVIAGQMLAGAAFAIAVAASRWDPVQSARRGGGGDDFRFQDLGNLLLMYVLLWAYLAYTQFLIMWSENLPQEIRWYVPRLQTSWVAVGVILVGLHFALPLLILLSRSAKRSPAVLAVIAAGLLAAHLVDAFWLVMPSLRPAGFAIAWSDPAAVVFVGAIWTWLWWRAASREPIATERAHG